MTDEIPSTQLTDSRFDESSLIVPAGNIGGRSNISVLPASGFYGTSWPSNSGSVIPQGIGGGGWTIDPTTPNTYDRGYKQQTFLGASIRSFSMNGGFGDSSATLSVDLVNDEFNNSDNTLQGQGDDVYHSGNGDRFVPPIAGTPVYFKFGQDSATVEQAYRKTFDQLYNMDTLGRATPIQPVGVFDKNNFTSLPDDSFVMLEANKIYSFQRQIDNELRRGMNHLVFGGILQSYIQNRGPGGNPLYSVQVTDPREILSNVIIILNNYAGTTFSTKNIFNVYGFLEHNMTAALSGTLSSEFQNYNILTKIVNPSNGYISYNGSQGNNLPMDCWYRSGGFPSFGASQRSFPVTGTGFSRRGPQGIPYYRVAQALSAMMSTEFSLPNEYESRGFGKIINFRGYNYVVDFSGLPQIPLMYFLDFDQINLLDLAMEICDVASRDLYVSLLPVINHPACQFLYNNQNSDPTKLIAGIIRLDSIDRSGAPVYGAIKTYIDSLATSGILVENQDVGYELSNVTTDKFVVGAQEVDMYCFSTNADRDFINVRNRRSGGESDDADWKQWTLEKQLEQQVLPYYGTLGKNAVTIPKGWGAYQQILLDTTGLNVNGVGSYYVATEMELRCASISYECWKNFLGRYNNTYLESLEDDDSFEGAVLNQTPSLGGANIPVAPNISNNYGVTVPRSVFDTYAVIPFGSDGFPSSPCNPPYGYPLYYKRMSKLGIPEGGLTTLQSRITGMITGGATIRGADGENYEEIRNNQLEELEVIAEDYGSLTPAEREYYNAMKTALQSTPPNIDLLNDIEESLHKINAVLPRLAKKGTENALKVYEFLKRVADENLGKKFLVKIPNKVNLFYENNVSWKNGPAGAEYATGPFGFKPRPSTSGIGDEFAPWFVSQYRGAGGGGNMIKSFLNDAVDPSQQSYNGALKANFNPITDKYEFNYTPANLGGYFPFDLYSNTLSYADLSRLPEAARPMGIVSSLVPQDLTNFLDENGRISPYVRFDNSQHIDMGSMNSEDFTQQVITPQGMIPDICEFLDNTGDDVWTSFDEADSDRPDNTNKPKQCAFVKCSVDEKFYMAPKTALRTIQVYGGADPRTKVTRPRKIHIPCSGWRDGIVGGTLVPGTGVYVDSFRYLELNFVPTSSEQGNAQRLDFLRQPVPELNSDLVRTDLSDLDTNHVYVLITLPNKIIPTKDARYTDSVNQKDNTHDIKHYLTMDVVKGLPEFATPAYASKASTTNITHNDPTCATFTAETRSAAWLASKKAKASLQFGFPQQVQQASPSPVYPDLVVIPLISNERCYGPWVSSQVDVQSSAYVNIGGRVEFIKDENLSPWNYAGYELMNEAGVLQAQFANSLLLFSERGGFSYPGMPTTSLCQVLLSGGPLVTNISVDVNEGGIKTTYKMDLYTASFGKLQKQKQDMISKISRERQRLRDERNALIRKGIGKSQSSTNIIGNINTMMSNVGMGAAASQPKNYPTYMVASVSDYETKAYSASLAGNSSAMFGTEGSTPPGQVDQTDYVYSSTMMTQADITNIENSFDSNIQRQAATYKAAAADMKSRYKPCSKEPYHHYMAHTPYVDFKASYSLYEKPDSDFKINPNDVTLPG
jgi:hypothetical protein